MTAVDSALRATRTTCPYCGVGCGVLATPDDRGGAAISGDPEHPANFGRLCSKGSALGETLGLEDRLLYPMIRCSKGTMERVAWSDALDHVAHRFAHIIKRDGPGAVAFYLSGQLLTEDYYVANKLMKGFIGSANVDTNSRLCMASSVAGHRRVFGSDTVPGCYEDIDEADLIVLVGSNAAWCHPLLYQRMILARERRGARLVAIDVRGTATTETADLALTIQPGMDGVLFSALLVRLAETGQINQSFVENHTEGYDETLARARAIAPDLAVAARKCGLEEQVLSEFLDLWCATERVVTLYSQGVNQSWQGTDKVTAILNCHLAAGRIGRPGMGPFSLTGQPNAMGGREVGGLANQLAAHMGFSPAEVDRVGRFWRASRMATREGLKAVDLFEAVGRSEVKALWIMGTNPAVSLPQADDVRTALRNLDLLVISDNVRSNDTIAVGAHVLLPATAWGEKDGTVTNSERCISRQRPFLAPAAEARPDWWAMAQVARRLGFGEAFAHDGPAAIFREHAALSAFENDGSRDFDIGALAQLSDAGYEALAPVQWPLASGANEASARLFADGRFFTASGRARLTAITPPSLARTPSAESPLLLNTGRIRDQWHTMTRTGLSPRLGSHLPEPFVEVNPQDAKTYGLVHGELAEIRTAHGRAILRVKATTAQEPGRLFAPIHWSDETAAGARIGALIHAITDPASGQPDAKSMPASIAATSFARQGLILSRTRLRPAGDGIYAWRAIEGGYVAGVATNVPAEKLFAGLCAACPDAERMHYHDPARGTFRAAFIAEHRLVAVIFLGLDDRETAYASVAEMWKANQLDEPMRRRVLAGKSASSDVDMSPTVCACFGVTSRAIESAIGDGASSTLEIGARLKAGTNCGSCLPELRKFLASRNDVAA